MKPEFIVGAYASLPQGRPSQELYYMLLGEQSWVRGTELPFPGDLANEDDRHWLPEHLPADGCVACPLSPVFCPPTGTRTRSRPSPARCGA